MPARRGLRSSNCPPHVPWDDARNFSGGRDGPKYDALIVIDREQMWMVQREDSPHLRICINGVLVTDKPIPPWMIERVFHYLHGRWAMTYCRAIERCEVTGIVGGSSIPRKDPRVCS